MKEYIKNLLIVLLYIITTFFGFFLIVTWDKSLEVVRYGTLFTIVFIIIAHIVLRIIIQRQWTLDSLLQLVSYLVLFVIIYMYFNPITAAILISVCGGIWLIIDGMIKCFYGIQRFWQHRVLSILYIIFGIVTFLFALILIQLDEQAFYFVRLFLGVYFIVFGLFHILDAILRRPYFMRFFHRLKLFEVNPRTFFSIYSPKTFRLHYDELSPSEKRQFKRSYKINKDIKPVEQLHLYVHMKYPLADMLGHVDFAVDGINYAYGNYDESTLQWRNNRSDGVLMVTPNHKYLQLSVRNYRKIIASFTLNITKEQKQKLLEAINNRLATETYTWDPDTMVKKTSYSKQIKKRLQATFYKFTSESVYHTYITATTNCVHFFDTILSEAGIKVFPNQTVTTPGDIFQILNKCAEDPKDQLVIKRKLLTRDDFEDNGK